MAKQKKQTKDIVTGDLFPGSVFAAEPSPERIKEIEILNLTTECLQWKKKFEASEAKVLAQENEIRRIMERNGVVEGKNSSARNLVQGHLKDFPLPSETKRLFKNVLRVLDPHPDEFTCKCQSAQQTLPSLGFGKTGPQNYLDIPVTRTKRPRISVGNEVSQKRERLNKRSSSSTTSKITQQCRMQKHSKKSSVSKTPSKIGETSTGVDPPQIQMATAAITPTSELQSTFNTLYMEKSKFSSAADQQGNSQSPRSAQWGTSRLVKNGNEDSRPAPVQIAVESFSKSLSLHKNYTDDGTKAIIEKLCVRLKCDAVALKLAVSYIKQDLLVLADPLKDIIKNYIVKIDNDIIRGGSKVPELVENPSYRAWRMTYEKIRATSGIGEKSLKVLQIISFLAAENIPTQFVLKLYEEMENMENSTTGENIFQILKRFSVIKSGHGSSISIHPLIQQASRIYLEEQEMFMEILGRIQSGAHKIIKRNGISSEEFIHIKSIWEDITETADLIEEDGGFPTSICKELNKSGQYREMYDFSCQAVMTLGSTLGENHRSTLGIKYWKVVALYYLGEHSKALELVTDIFEKKKEMFGEEDGDCLNTVTLIGLLYWKLKKYDEALKWFRDTLQKRDRIFGVEHPETLTLKHNIARVLDEQGKCKEAVVRASPGIRRANNEKGTSRGIGH